MPTAKKTARKASKKTKQGTAPAAVRKPRPKLNVAASKKPRHLPPKERRTLNLTKRIKHPVRLPNVWWLTKATARTLWGHKGLFFGVVLVYGILNLVLVQGLANSADVGSLKNNLSSVFHGHFSALGSSLAIFTVLVGSSGNSSSATAGAYQGFLVLLGSLAVIWALRQALAGAPKIRIRDPYYRGIYPLVPFVLVLLVIGLQLIPAIVGLSLYGLVMGAGIAVHVIEKVIWTVICVALVLSSLYMVASSLIGLYVVTLPEMTPRKALRSARLLVRYRRWTVIRKVLFLPVLLLVVAAIIMVPIIVFVTPIAQWVFFLLTMCALAVIHAYMYTLYRELLNE